MSTRMRSIPLLALALACAAFLAQAAVPRTDIVRTAANRRDSSTDIFGKAFSSPGFLFRQRHNTAIPALFRSRVLPVTSAGSGRRGRR